jgi:iron complex transport system ATP-binding protein
MILQAQGLSLEGRLDDLSCTLAPGQITAICGPNGAGKSSLLQAMAGLLAPDTGQVLLGEEGLSGIHPRARARSIGFLPQDGVVTWDVSVRNLVALGRLPHGDRGTQVVEQVLATLDLLPLADRVASQLSGGERGRALLGRVLAGEPRWLLADEPLAALDLAHQLALLRHLRAVAESGSGVVIVLHDLALAMNHADRVLVLDRGRLTVDATPELALDRDVIARVWGVEGEWIGRPGERALVTRAPGHTGLV